MRANANLGSILEAWNGLQYQKLLLDCIKNSLFFRLMYQFDT